VHINNVHIFELDVHEVNLTWWKGIVDQFDDVSNVVFDDGVDELVL